MKAHALAPLALMLCATLVACGDETHPDGVADPHPAAGGESALTLTPRIDVQGIGDVFETLHLAHLDFDAELFVLPTDNRNAHPGAVVAIRVNVDDEVASTESLDGDLALEHAGRYRVLLRIDPSEDGVSVKVDGEVVDPGAYTRNKAEPAPIAADDSGGGGEGDDDEPAPTPAEPAPTPAEPAPTPAEPAPTPSEPAPTPADDPWGEAGDAFEPIPGGEQGGPPRSEPAPTPAEPAPTPARAKADQPGIDPGDTRSAGATVSVSSRASYEFYVGVVEIETDDSELVITWDVSAWLRDLLAEPLGIAPGVDEAADPGVPGAFHDIAATFQLIAQ